MSGALKAVGKIFKKAVKAVGKAVKGVADLAKKIAKPVLIAAAVYFTAGVAVGAFGGASAISSLPGWGAEGIFTKAAAAIGAPGFTSVATSQVAPAAVAGSGAGSTALEIGGAIGSVEGATATAAGSIPAAAAGGTAATANGAAALVGNAAAPAAAGAQGGGIIGSVARGVGGFVRDNPIAAMMLGQGASSAATAYRQSKDLEEERKYQIDLENRRGFFGMDRLGTQIELPTVGDRQESLLAPPTVGRQATQTQQAQSGRPPGGSVVLTEQELLNLQNGYIRNPGRA